VPSGPSVTLAEHRGAWLEKPSLRAVYHDLYRRMAKATRPGKTLEIGGGTGNFKAFVPETVSTDIQYADWLDVVCDAHELPFANQSFDNIVMFDVLHHLERPRLFLSEAARVLQSGGRVVLVEPAITPISRFFYTHFHPEPVDMSEDPLGVGARTPDRDPYDSNQAIPTLLFQRHSGHFATACPELMLKQPRYLSLFTYPLTGGFRAWTLVPGALVPMLLKLEDVLLPLLGPLMGFRLFVVLERK
jgi:SAM-dependent methyltransferase